MKLKLLSLAVVSASLLTACGGSDSNGNSTSPLEALGIECVPQEDYVETTVVEEGDLTLSLAGTYVSGNEFDTASAEIVSYDSCSDRLYVVNAEEKTIDVLALAEGTSVPSHAGTIDLSSAAASAGIAIGAANSVSAKKGLVAVAIEAGTRQDDGILALYRSDTLELIATYSAGALPDMVTLSEDARYILSANEGEPSGDYSNDPQGSVTIVDLKDGFTAADAVVSQVLFTDFNSGGSRADDVPAGLRLAGPSGTSVAQDLEPEYLTLNADGSTAWVSLQENNGMAIIDVANASVSSLVALGKKRWDENAELDPSDKDDVIFFDSYEQLVGLYMPDTVASIEMGGETYILTANEGDGREYIYETTERACDDAGHTWDGDDNRGNELYDTEINDCISFTDEARGKDIVDLVDDAHPLKEALDDKALLGRIKVTNDVDSYAATDDIVTFGARSFSIWDASGTLVYDSGDEIANEVYRADAANFNSTNDENNSADNRSDDKGTEPEAIEVANIKGRFFAFVGLERQGGVMVFDITDPTAPVFQSYLNNRNFSEGVCTELDGDECDNDTYNEAVGDLGPESIDYFTRGGQHYIAVGN
ncbi:MAG TPA: alkaline phosphatase, partial [Oceanospirillales bacterium]|nr:alkaline phosphatase [Oceanospirillales bacterium]